MSVNGSMIGLSSRKARSPSAVYGIERVRLGREDEAVGHDERVVAGVLGRLREGREVGRIAEGLGVAEAHGRDLCRSSSAGWHRPVDEVGAAGQSELGVPGTAEGRERGRVAVDEVEVPADSGTAGDEERTVRVLEVGAGDTLPRVPLLLRDDELARPRPAQPACGGARRARELGTAGAGRVCCSSPAARASRRW